MSAIGVGDRNDAVAVSTKRRSATSSQSLWKRMWRARGAYLFIAPFFILFAVFGIYPIVYSLVLSLYSWSGFDEKVFVGLENFQSLMQDSLFWLSLKNTVIMWLGHIFILIVFAIALALLLNRPWVRGRGVYRAIAYIPNTAAIAAMALSFQLIFDYQYGILNQVLNQLGIENINWTGSSSWSKVAIILLNIWNMLGWYMLIILAGLQSLDPQLYEAAAIDGAGAFRKLVHVTLPGLRPTIFFVFVVETIGSLQIFTEPYVLTKGGPSNSSLSLAMYLYQNGFEYFRIGYAASMSVVLFVLTIAATLLLTLVWRGDLFNNEH
ncbi:MAG: sugar transporter permease [Propionibacteriaceae bacterium]|jgi:cellobiose transport system permease protein|nr:sugar transporter permease [Propionibacteriaceae bacterium]